MNALASISAVQWMAIAAASALVIAPRWQAIKDSLGGLLAPVWPLAKSPPAELEDADAFALRCFKGIRVKLGNELAAQVWAKIQPTDPEEPKS